MLLLGSTFYRVCHGSRLTKQDDYFWVDFDHFWIERHFFEAARAVVTISILDRFQDRSKTGSGINFFPTFLAAFFAAFFATFFAPFFAAFFVAFFGPAFWSAFLSTQYKRCAILSMQYKIHLPFLRVGGCKGRVGGWGVARGVCV